NEWMLSEAHLFRYVIQYLYTVQEHYGVIKSAIIKQDNKKFIDFFVNNVWNKWEYESRGTMGDMTLFYGIRTHMGSHWATMAMFLEKLSSDQNAKKKYKAFYTSYDTWLRSNMKLQNDAYIWNSTWDKSKLKFHTNRKAKGFDAERIQDVAHGNHIIQY